MHFSAEELVDCINVKKLTARHQQKFQLASSSVPTLPSVKRHRRGASDLAMNFKVMSEEVAGDH